MTPNTGHFQLFSKIQKWGSPDRLWNVPLPRYGANFYTQYRPKYWHSTPVESFPVPLKAIARRTSEVGQNYVFSNFGYILGLLMGWVLI